MNIFENLKGKRINDKFFIFILLFLSFGIIYAPNTFASSLSGGGRVPGGGSKPGEVTQEQASLGWKIGSVASCYSESVGWTYPATPDEKQKLDNPIGAFAHKTFDNTGAWNAQASSSENVTEHGGLNKNPVLCSRTGINKK